MFGLSLEQRRSAMSQQLRRRYKLVKSLEDRLNEEAKRLREEAELLLLLRAQVLRKAPQAETPLARQRMAEIARTATAETR
jgi:hypothetical protein